MLQVLKHYQLLTVNVAMCVPVHIRGEISCLEKPLLSEMGVTHGKPIYNDHDLTLDLPHLLMSPEECNELMGRTEVHLMGVS